MLPNVPPSQRVSRYKTATENGIIVIVSSRSATVMLAMNRFVTLRDEDFFKTTNRPKELPIRATRKMTAYAVVRPIFTLIFIGMPPVDCCGLGPPLDAVVMFVPKTER